MDKNKDLLEIQEKYQNSQVLEEQLKIVEQQITELQQFSEAINFLLKNNEKEILASVGKGVFVKSEIKEKDFFVDVGSGIFVKKKPEEIKNISEEQLSKLYGMKIQLGTEMAGLDNELRELINNSKESD